MTYRSDSDIFYPYSYLIRKNLTSSQEARVEAEIKSSTKLKSKPIVWFVSNCVSSSKREAIAKALGQHIQVDVFGACGDKSVCPKSEGRSCVEKLVNKKYYFHIAFENSLCKDYISEKYWGRWQYFSIPIVLQRKIYEKFAPPKSFIAVDDFKTIPEMAKRLKFLTKNRTAYMEYFKWRKQGYSSSHMDENDHHFGFCGVCQRLWTERPLKPKTYRNIGHWWNEGSHCDTGEFAERMIKSG